ncbi:MAG: hypothetical protein A2007_01750 [Verrucomicrobia bacterium GWC2_42_7]|nr:MAG: hypothetical protein A2007_01750 [Verrucomicrobia bacterium GWC2_42_7]
MQIPPEFVSAHYRFSWESAKTFLFAQKERFSHLASSIQLTIKNNCAKENFAKNLIFAKKAKGTVARRKNL